MAEPLDFYFDFASPYAYLASLRIDVIAGHRGRTVRWRPILLGAVFKVTGAAPNMHLPLKGAYLVRDVQRCARALGVPLTLPAVMPLHSLLPARAFYWLGLHDPKRAVPFAKAVFHHHWGLGLDAGTLEAVEALAANLGIDGPALIAGCQAPAIKARLRTETDAAIERGVFGAPFIFIGDEPFWGADRLPDVARWLETGPW